MADRGEILLGGCIYDDEMSRWFCQDCGKEIRSPTPNRHNDWARNGSGED